MGVEYRLDVINTLGTKVAEIGGRGKAAFLELGCDKQVNSVGLMSFTLNYEHAAVSLMADKYLVHLYRRWPEKNIPWYLFFPGIYRDDVREDNDGNPRVTFLCPEQKHMLSWCHNLYPAATTNKSKWTGKATETVLKDVVRNNFTSTGTTGFGRDINATNGGTLNGYTFTVEADSLRGTTLNYESARGEVLKDLQDVISKAGAGDFDLVKTGATTFDFRYYPLLGTDRTSTITFSTTFGNLRNVRLVTKRSEEKTVIVVGGGGTGASRAKVNRTGANYNVTTNKIEGFANGAITTGGTTNTTTLNAIGDGEVVKKRARPVLTYEVVQDGPHLLDRDYFLGDKTSVSAFGLSLVQQMYGASMLFTDEGEKIAIRTREF